MRITSTSSVHLKLMLLQVKCDIVMCCVNIQIVAGCHVWSLCPQEGKEFDALVVDVAAAGSPFDVFDTDTLEVCMCVCVCVYTYMCTHVCRCVHMCVGVCVRV